MHGKLDVHNHSCLQTHVGGCEGGSEGVGGGLLRR